MSQFSIIIFAGVAVVLYSIMFYFLYQFLFERFKSTILVQYKNILSFIAIFFLVLSLVTIFQEGSLIDVISWTGYLVFGFIFSIYHLFLNQNSNFEQNLVFNFNGIRMPNLVEKIQTSYSKGPRKSRHSVDQIARKKNSRKKILVKTNHAILKISGASNKYGLKKIHPPASIFRHSVHIPHLPDAFEGFKIVQISDIHAGQNIQRKFIEQTVNQVNELEPDMVAITGDLVDGSVKTLRDFIAPLSNLVSTYGSYFTTGNHEYYSGVDDWLLELQNLGIKTLVNSHHIITNPKDNTKGHLFIAGVPDIREGPSMGGHPYDPEGTLKIARDIDIKILLAHQPRGLERSLHAGVDLQLSGHTHGGQFFPWNIAVNLIYPYPTDLHLYKNKMWINVNRGTGYWGPPIRGASPAEITLLTLKKGDYSSK